MNILYLNVNTFAADEVWRVLECMEIIKIYEDRLYLTVDDAINAVTINTNIKQATGLKVTTCCL